MHLSRRAVLLTGRCYFLQPTHSRVEDMTASPVSTSSSGVIQLTDFSATPSNTSSCFSSSSSASSSSHLPHSLSGNGYYSERFDSCRHRRRTEDKNTGHLCGTHSLTCRSFVIRRGDVLVSRVDSVAPSSCKRRAMIDTTGLHTCYINAAERRSAALLTLDETVWSMHLQDGSSVPQLCRGAVPVGHLRLFACRADACCARIAGTSAHGTIALRFSGLQAVMLPLESRATRRHAGAQTTAWPSLSSRNLMFSSQENAMQMVRTIAEMCAQSACQKDVVLKPVVRERGGVPVALQIAPRMMACH